MAQNQITIDGNSAVAAVAHALSEVCAIYPITPSSGMGETADARTSAGKTNIWGTLPQVTEMQSEGGAAGAIHGAVQGGALCSTFTASQGLLLMMPNMFKIAGELSPVVFHVSARSVATHALSIFGDHSDVMAVRSTGFALLSSTNIQEVQDLGAIAHAATLESRVPFLHFFDGFRSSHEIQKITELSQDEMRKLVDDAKVIEHRSRAMTPDRPVLRGTAQNPDVFFQARERCNPYYDACPEIVQNVMDRFAQITGRQYKLFDYVGAPDAEKVVVIMGSGADAAQETVEYLTGQGEKVGVLKVRLYRPWSTKHFIEALPSTVKAIAVMDRTKEPGAAGEPMYIDVRTAIGEAMAEGYGPFKSDYPRVLGGRYGLSSKEFTPAMVKAVFENLDATEPKNHFTVGIKDDVTNTSLDFDPEFSTEPEDVFRGVFYGLGSDGTVGANKNSIKIIGDETDNFAQGFFVYDSKKAGSRTTSHLRFGPRPIRSTYLVHHPSFVACHQWSFLEKYDMLGNAVEGATFLLNAPYDKDEVWNRLPREVQQQIIDKKIEFYAIDAYKVGQHTGMGVRINTIMQTCFFAISGILPKDEAIDNIKQRIKKTYGSKGEDIVRMNYAAVDESLANLHKIEVPAEATSTVHRPATVAAEAPEFVQQFTAPIIRGEGDTLPVSRMPEDGSFPTATTQWEKRNVALRVPVWEPDLCIQCGKCSIVCPHGTIRMKIYPEDKLGGASETFKSAEAKGKGFEGMKCTVQVAVEDCTGCGACVFACPAKDKEQPQKKAINLQEQIPIRETERENFKFFMTLPELDTSQYKLPPVKDSQLRRPLFEFSGACAGCGETPYVKLMSQLFGDRTMIANATGCSSIYGGNLPTTPYCVDEAGRGPTWSNSLFEDNAEFGVGMRLAVNKANQQALELLDKCECLSGSGQLVEAIKTADQSTTKGIEEQRARVKELKDKLAKCTDTSCQMLSSLADYLVKKSVWILGGDGWAYDIGYGGLDHALALGLDINVLVLDTEVYSNTGGQMSKATPTGAVAAFAASGKPTFKKDLGMMMMSYGNIYIARVAMGYNDATVVKAFQEAESYNGPSIVIAYTHCIAQGIKGEKGWCGEPMGVGMGEHKRAVASGHWIPFRYDPRLSDEGKNPLQLDCKDPSIGYREFAEHERRFQTLMQSDPEAAEKLMDLGQKQIEARWSLYKQMAEMDYSAWATDGSKA